MNRMRALQKLTGGVLVFLFFIAPLAPLSAQETNVSESEGAVMVETEVQTDVAVESVLPETVATELPENETTPVEPLAAENEIEESAMLDAEEASPYYSYERKPIKKDSQQIEPQRNDGSFAYQYPLTLPLGRNGMAPALSLQYDSNDNDQQSLVGAGWSLPIPYIERMNRTGTNKMYKDNYYNSSFDGELVKIGEEETGEGEELASCSSPYTEILSMEVMSAEALEALAAGNAVGTSGNGVTLLTPVESVGKRSENSRSYLQGWDADGKPRYEERFYANPIHYRDEQGKYQVIDPILIDYVDGWAVERAAYSAKLAKRAGDRMLAFSHHGQRLYLSTLDENKDTVNAYRAVFDGITGQRKVIYPDALGKDVDIEIAADNESVTKDVVIKDLAALEGMMNEGVLELKFFLTTNRIFDILIDGQRLSEVKSIESRGQAEVIDSEGAITYIRPARAIDSGQNEFGYPNRIGVPVRYEWQDNGILITKKVPAAWLGKAVYPVRADLTLSHFAGAGDGYVQGVGYNNFAWYEVYDSTNGTTANYTGTTIEARTGYNGQSYTVISRAFLSFNTSGLRDDIAIESSALHMFVSDRWYSDHDGHDFITIVQGFQGSSTMLTTYDFPHCGNQVAHPAEGIDSSNRLDLQFATTSQYAQFPLNSAGRDWINPSGYTQLGIREGHDVLDDQIVHTTAAMNFITIRSSEYSGTSSDPYLSVVYSDAPVTPVGLETEIQTDPINITDPTPEFTAVYREYDSGDTATDYRIQVTATSSDWTNLVWDSNKTEFANPVAESQRCAPISYNGGTLRDGRVYYWRIKFWDEDDHEGVWSGGEDNFEFGDRYRAKNEGGDFRNYEFVDNTYWKVTDKQGVVYIFGQASTTRVQKGTSTDHTYRWLLEEKRDLNGNYISYTYDRDQGQLYLKTIRYTGNGSDTGNALIEFFREARTDKATTTNAGFPIRTGYRINEIRASVNGSWVKKYELDYATGDNGRRSLLSAITETGRDTNGNILAYPPTTFNYQTTDKSWTVDENYSVPISFIDSRGLDTGARLADVNGDGLSDIVHGAYHYQRKVYINDGDGTGWTEDANFVLPVDIVGEGGEDYGVRIVDVNGDYLADIIQSWQNVASRVYINNGNGTGWTQDENYSGLPNFVFDSNGSTGARLADVNGDGLVDIITNDKVVHLNKGDGTGWSETNAFMAPVAFLDSGWNDTGVRSFDVNGDGLTDFVQYLRGDVGRVYINNGDSTGWTINDNYTVPFYFQHNFDGDMGVGFDDINGDGLADITRAIHYVSSEVYLNKGDGTGWVQDASYTGIPYTLDDGNRDVGGRYGDIDGDGLADAVNNFTSVSIRNGEKVDLLTRISDRRGSVTTIAYKGSAEYVSAGLDNPDLPFIVQTAHTVSFDDGNGTIATTTYDYAGGDFYYANAFDKRSAGFGAVTATDGLGNVSKTYFHQGNASATSTGEFDDNDAKIGRAYRAEVYDENGNKYKQIVQHWESTDLGNGSDFVYRTRTLAMDYDGDSDHRDKAVTFRYSAANGNLTGETNWGEVAGNNDGSFTDTGTDLASTTISYAASTTLHLIGLPSRQAVYDQSGNLTRETKYYYDTLAYGQAGKGNLTKKEHWKSGTNYIDIERTFDNYGLVTQEKDPRDKVTNYTYDCYHLYVATSTNALSQKTEAYYDYSSGQITRMIDPNGLVFETVYDPLDRKIEEKQPDTTTPSTLVVKTSISYIDTAPRYVHERSYLSGSNSVDRYTYLDGLDRVIQTRQETEATGTFAVLDRSYDKVGNLEHESLPYFSTNASTTATTASTSLYTVFRYDPLARPLTVADAIGTTTYAYDQWRTTITDPEGNQKDLTNDAFGNMVQVDEHNDASTYTTEYDYDLNGNLITIEDALDNVRHFTYDGLGRLLKSEDLHAPADSYFSSTTNSYDNSGNLTRRIDGNLQTVNFTYDDLNRVLTEDYTGAAGTDVSYRYDTCAYGKGRLCIATSTGAVTKSVYDPLGNLAQESRVIGGVSYTTAMSYDRQGNPLTITAPDGAIVSYGYGRAGQLRTIANRQSGGSDITVVAERNYNPAGQLTYLEYGNGAKTYNTYDQDARYRPQNRFTLLPDTGEQGFDQFALGLGYTDEAEKAALAESSTLVEALVTDSVHESVVDQQDFASAAAKTILKRSTIIPSRSSDILSAFSAAKTNETNELSLLDSNSAPNAPKYLLSEGHWFTGTITTNPGYEINLEDWNFYSPNGASVSRDCIIAGEGNCSAKVNVATSSPNWWDSMFYQPLRVEGGVNFTLSFWARAEATTTVLLSFSQDHDPWYGLGLEKDVTLTPAWREYRYSLTAVATDEAARILFGCGETAGDYWFDDVRVIPDALNVIDNNSFENTADLTDWTFWSYGQGGAAGTNAVVCSDATEGDCAETVDMTAAGDHWQVQLAQAVSVSGDEDYLLTFDAKASEARTIHPVIAQNHDPWNDLSAFTAVNLTTEWQTYLMELSPSATDANARLLFYLGEDDADIKFDNIHLWTKQNLKVLDTAPEFSGIYDDPDTADQATAYRLQVTGEDGDFSDPLWDTGQSSLSPYVDEGDRTNDLGYTAYLALDGRTYHWRMKLWDATDEGEWSNGEDYFKMYGRIAQNLSYGYDRVGNITWFQDASDTNSAKTMDFGYDDLYRLTRASSTMAANGEDYLETYAYNAVGNITNKSDIGSYTYNGHQGTSYCNPHFADSIDSQAFVCDRNGNLTSDGEWNHAWDYRNRLVGSEQGSTTISYAYDHEGNRVKMDNGSSLFVYPNKYYNINGNKITRHIYAGDELIATIDANGQSTTTYYIHTDHLGGSSVISDSDGQIVEVTDYYPFGDLRLDEKEGEFSEQRKFTGHEHDETADLEYMVQRYYNGNVGRFMSQDPLIQSMGMLKKADKIRLLSNVQKLNAYSYVGNNPLLYSDPNGLDAVIFYGGNKKDPSYFRDIAYKNAQQKVQNGYKEAVYVKEGSSPQQWNSALSSVDNIDYIGYYGHGGTGALYLSNTTTSKGKDGTVSIISNTNIPNYDPKTDVTVDSLYNKNVEKNTKIELYSCNAGVGGSNSIAQAFASHFNGEAKGARAGINFDNEGKPYVSHFYHESISYWFEKNILQTDPYLWALFWK